MSRAKFEKIKEWPTQNEFNSWKSQRPATWSVENSYLAACSICSDSTHKMRTQYTRCNNTDCFKDGKQCPRRYKFNECQAGGKIVGYVAGEHSAKTFKPKFHGLTQIAREMVDQFWDDCNPYKYCRKLERDRLGNRATSRSQTSMTAP